MKPAALIAISTFLAAFLGCVQAINVNRGRRWAAAFTSVGIGACQLALYKVMPGVSDALQASVFLLAGIAGAQASMAFGRRAKP